MSTDTNSSETMTSNVPENDGSRLLHVLVFGSLLIPVVFIPYIPIRRHLLGLGRSLHTLSSETTLLRRELSNTLLRAQLHKEETLELAKQLHELRVQFDAITKRIAEYDNARLVSERDAAERHRATSDRAAVAETVRLKSEETLRRQVDILRRRADRERYVFYSN
jgi:hypothetical protein